MYTKSKNMNSLMPDISLKDHCKWGGGGGGAGGKDWISSVLDLRVPDL